MPCALSPSFRRVNRPSLGSLDASRGLARSRLEIVRSEASGRALDLRGWHAGAPRGTPCLLQLREDLLGRNGDLLDSNEDLLDIGGGDSLFVAYFSSQPYKGRAVFGCAGLLFIMYLRLVYVLMAAYTSPVSIIRRHFILFQHVDTVFYFARMLTHTHNYVYMNICVYICVCMI